MRNNRRLLQNADACLESLYRLRRVDNGAGYGLPVDDSSTVDFIGRLCLRADERGTDADNGKAGGKDTQGFDQTGRSGFPAGC